MAVAQQNAPKGEEKHPWRQLRFRVVAPLFITHPVCSVTAQGDGGKRRECNWDNARGDTDRGRPVNSRGEEKTIVYFPLDQGPFLISILGKEAMALKTRLKWSLEKRPVHLCYGVFSFVYYSASQVKIYQSRPAGRDRDSCLCHPTL